MIYKICLSNSNYYIAKIYICLFRGLALYFNLSFFFFLSPALLLSLSLPFCCIYHKFGQLFCYSCSLLHPLIHNYHKNLNRRCALSISCSLSLALGFIIQIFIALLKPGCCGRHRSIVFIHPQCSSFDTDLNDLGNLTNGT